MGNSEELLLLLGLRGSGQGVVIRAHRVFGTQRDQPTCPNQGGERCKWPDVTFCLAYSLSPVSATQPELEELVDRICIAQPPRAGRGMRQRS